MTEDLRANMATSHIPVVLLTAKTDMDSKLEGMELGVEDYITKPFSATYLKARVENILTQRVKLQQLYCANLMNIQPVADTVANANYRGADVDWYVKADDIVLKNKGNQNAGNPQNNNTQGQPKK